MPGCDIIIPVWNQLELTRNCIDSLEKNTVFPYRLIVVDNASNPKTVEYLEGLKNRLKDRMVLVKNEKNEGFVKAVNKGLALSNEKFVCVLNNDTVVTRGWLSEMVKLFDEDPRIGIINPSSNSLGQKMPRGTTLDEYGKLAKTQSGLYCDLGSALGFCMLLKREIFRKVRQFDEVYGMGNYDDTDFSLRVKREGYKVVRSFASYVYHKEKSSFNVLKNFKKSFSRNKKVFETRWSSTHRALIILSAVNDASRAHLYVAIKKHAKEKSWLYVVCPPLATKEFFEKFSNLTFYHYRRFFYILAFFKVLFKKKKPAVVYCDNKRLLSLLEGLLPRMRFKLLKSEER